jgi:hypothetical protein
MQQLFMKNVQSIVHAMYPVHHYMVIIRPSDAIVKRMRGLRQQWREKYQLENRQLQGGFVLLARFSQFASLQQKVLDRLSLVAMEAAPVKLQLRNFVCVPGQAVGIHITNPEGMQRIVRQMQQDQRIFKGPSVPPFFNHDPALWLATRLQPEQHARLWAQVSYRSFTGSFVADTMMVLVRAENDSRWQIAAQMPLQNLPVSSKQGVLFAA